VEKDMKIGLWNYETGELIAEFDTLEEAIEYAEEHDLKCYIKLKEGIFPETTEH
jgi:hypothetical protein